jgi:ParB family chromosome partitioning protein
MVQRKALGRGLEALISATGQERTLPDTSSASVREIEVDRIELNPYQPRARIDTEKFRELVSSIGEKGIVQPIVVNQSGDAFVLIAGERRLKAFRTIGKKKIPAIVMQVSEEEMLELSLIENIQREELNPVDEARAYRMLLEHFQLTQEDVSRKVGKDRSTVANSLRLLQLPDEIQQMLLNHSLTPGHARALLALESPRIRIRLARETAEKGLSVREVERRVREFGKKSPGEKGSKKAADPHVASIEEMLKRLLGTRVKVQQRGTGGMIEIFFSSSREFERLVNVLREIER